MQRRFGPDAVFVAGGVALILAYFALGPGTPADVVYEGLGIASVVAIATGIRLRRPEPVMPWVLFALANTASLLGDLFFHYRANSTSASLGDGFYLAAYPLFAAALLVLLFKAGGHHRFGALAEAGVATFAFALVQWVALMQPVLSGNGSLQARIVSATYPVGDVVLLRGLRRPPRLARLAEAVVLGCSSARSSRCSARTRRTVSSAPPTPGAARSTRAGCSRTCCSAPRPSTRRCGSCRCRGARRSCG